MGGETFEQVMEGGDWADLGSRGGEVYFRPFAEWIRFRGGEEQCDGAVSVVESDVLAG